MEEGTKSTPKNKHKYIISLEHFLVLQSEGLNQLDAFDLYGETCLHSTVSMLANDRGIKFKRRREPHKHRGRGTTHFMRYWLNDNGQAVKMLSNCEKWGK